jgi:hypothetical protein
LPLTQRDAMIWTAGGDFMMGSYHQKNAGFIAPGSVDSGPIQRL